MERISNGSPGRLAVGVFYYFHEAKSNLVIVRIFVLFILFSSSLVAQKRHIHWQKPEHQISYAPYTTHYFRGDLAVSHLSSINYGWAEIGYFINSYRDATVAFCYKTEVLEYRNWTGHLIIGTLYGYHKNLYNYPYIPLSGTILFKTEFTPIGGATVEYHFTDKIGLKATFVPLVGGIGLNYKL